MAKFLVDVLITPKQGVRDPDGDQVFGHLEGAIGSHSFTSLVAGKFYRLELEANNLVAAKDQVKLACEKYLVNMTLNAYEAKVTLALKPQP